MANGDIKINGQPYRIITESYKWRDMTDFAPKATVPGGSIIHSELLLYQPLLQTDWKHGFGFHWYEDASGYMLTTGQVDTRQSGLAMLYTSGSIANVNEPTDKNRTGFTYFNNKVWAYGAEGLASYTSGSWVNSISGSTVNSALATKDYLFVCVDGQQLRKVDTSGSVSTTGVGSTADDFLWLTISNGYIYGAIDDTNQLHRSSNATLADMEGDTTDTNTIYCGAGGFEVKASCNYGGYLYLARQDGLWQLGTDLVAKMVIDYSTESSPDNFASLIEYNGFLVFPIRDRIVEWNGARRSDITPPKITDTFPYLTYGAFKCFTKVGDYLYCIGKTSGVAWSNRPDMGTTYIECLLCFDGVGWHRLADLCTNGTDSISAMWYDAINNRLWYHKHSATTNDVTYYIPFQDRSVFPYAYFPVAGTHSLYTSRLDMGFRRVIKSTPSLLVEASNLSEDHYYLKVYFSIDGGTFMAWGGLDGITNIISEDGVTELIDPLSGLILDSAQSGNGVLSNGFSTIEYNYLQLRIDFITDTATQSPVLEGLTVRFLMRPDTFYGYSFQVVVKGNFEFASGTDERDAHTLVTDLRTARDSKAPIDFVDMEGINHKTYVSALNATLIEQNPGESGAYPDLESLVTVSLTEVK